MGTDNQEQKNDHPVAKAPSRKDDQGESRSSKAVNRKVIMLEHISPKTSIRLVPEMADTTADQAFQMEERPAVAGRYGSKADYVVLPKIDNPTRGHRKTYSDLKSRYDKSQLGEFCYNHQGAFDLQRSIQKPKIDCVKNRKADQHNEYPSEQTQLALNREQWYTDMDHPRMRDSLTYKSHVLNNVSQLEPERQKGKLCGQPGHHGNLISHPPGKPRKNVAFLTPSEEQYKQHIQNNYNFKYPIRYQECE